MVDNATLKNPTGSLPSKEKTSTLKGETRTWTIRDSEESGTYTLQAILEKKKLEELADQVPENEPVVDISKAVQVYKPSAVETEQEETDQSMAPEKEGGEVQKLQEEDEWNRRTQLIVYQKKLKEKEVRTKEKKTLSTGWFIVSLILALFFDTTGGVINIIPIVGQIITTIIITPAGLLCLMYIYHINNIPFDRKARKRLVLTGVIEFIPVIQVIPALTFAVLWTKFSPIVEKEINKIGVKKEQILQQEKEVMAQTPHPNSAIMNSDQ